MRFRVLRFRVLRMETLPVPVPDVVELPGTLTG